MVGTLVTSHHSQYHCCSCPLRIQGTHTDTLAKMRINFCQASCFVIEWFYSSLFALTLTQHTSDWNGTRHRNTMRYILNLHRFHVMLCYERRNVENGTQEANTKRKYNWNQWWSDKNDDDFLFAVVFVVVAVAVAVATTTTNAPRTKWTDDWVGG